MSMTREEAITAFEEIKLNAQTHLGKKYAIGCEEYYKTKIDLAEAAISALRTPTREQVERMRGEWIHDGPEFEGGTDWYHCSKCGVKETGVYVQSNFCSISGQPKTDKAVDIMMERWEEAVKNA